MVTADCVAVNLRYLGFPERPYVPRTFKAVCIYKTYFQNGYDARNTHDLFSRD